MAVPTRAAPPNPAASTGPDAPRALIIRTAGTNCDAEMVRAFALAGAQPDLVHLDRLIAEPARLDDYDLIGFPGGFSYGDDIASGRIFAMKARLGLYAALRAAAGRGVPMIGVCNGFQIMVQAGLLPGPAAGEPWPEDEPPEQQVSLAANDCGCFIDDWVRIRVNPASPCVWTAGLAERWHGSPSGNPSSHDQQAADRILRLPIAHGEGRFTARDQSVLDRLAGSGQVALLYEDNPNGSMGDVAGICDPTGRIFGLMPHPERYVEWTQHPFWTRLGSDERQGDTPGLAMFKSAVRAAGGVEAGA